MSADAEQAEHISTAAEGEPGRRTWVIAVLQDAPWALLPAVTAAAVMIAMAFGPIRDIDLFWHLLVGDDIRSGIPIRAAGQGWSFVTTVPDTWVSSQWLAEVLLSWLHAIGGFPALVDYRVVTAGLALLVLALVCLRHRPMVAGAVPFMLGAIALASTTQERSQQLTFILAPLVGWWAERLLREGRLPRWYVVAPLVVVWANFHGGWVILPFALLLAAVGRWASEGWRDRPAVGAVALAAGCGLASMLSPLGPANALTWLTFSHATGIIAEWHLVSFWDPQGLPLLGVLLLSVICWSRGRTQPRLGELVLVLGFVGFGFIAYRDITPATLMLAPVLTGIITRALPESVTTPRPVTHAVSPPTDSRWRRWDGQPVRLGRTALAVAVIGAVVAVTMGFRSTAIGPADVPLRIYQRIAAHDGPVKVLNTYNVAGPLLFYGGRPPHVRVGIDGRTERYGGDYIEQYTQQLFTARPGWQGEFSRLNPDVVVIYSGEALASALLSERNWRLVDYQNGIELLVPPGATGW